MGSIYASNVFNLMYSFFNNINFQDVVTLLKITMQDSISVDRVTICHFSQND